MPEVGHQIKLLDHGYISLVECWGSDEGIVRAARMSTAKGFLGWGPKCKHCGVVGEVYKSYDCLKRVDDLEHEWVAGDEKLLKHLWDRQHSTPFEMAGISIEVKAPIVVLREWMRHRTQSFSEMSARYIPLPDENYRPSPADVLRRGTETTGNKQAQGTGAELTESGVDAWLWQLSQAYEAAQKAYEFGLRVGVPKELARLSVPVARYSVMRVSANLRNWLAFLKLRCDTAAQQEIRQYANTVAVIVKDRFPRTYEVSANSLGLPP